MVWGLNNAGVLPEATNVIAIAAGSERNLVLRADGTLLSWGSYTENQFGFPAGISNIVAIACGDGQNLALTADGIVIGSGSTFVSPAATNIVAIASGSGHSLALNADGNVLAWGYNGYGQTTVPDDATNVVAIAAGGYDSLALRGDGSLIGWGQNGNSLSAIPGRTNTIMIALGTGYSLGLDADGTVRGVGGAAISQGLKDVFSIAANSQGLALMGDSPPRTKAAMIPLRTTDGMVISLPLQSGRVARLEYVTNLEDTNWVALPLVPGNGATTHLIDPTTTGLQRFYRTRRW
jgi:alpha-tubulin suppressor-like RCC1 family protein